jgi:hypothetical protein
MRLNTDREHSEQQTKQSRWGFLGKTVWDWLQLLIVSLALVVIGLVFTMLQDARQQDFEKQRVELEQKIENQRAAEAEQELAEQRAQDEALQAYLGQMGSLLLEKDLRNSEEDSEVRTLARARTATVIQRLDSDRNANLIGFLNEAGLIWQGKSSIRLRQGADLRGAHLEGTDLSVAYLRGVDLSRIDPSTTPADLRYACAPADLRYANLRGATGLTYGKIAAAESLEGVTMPNGQKYEDWLRSKDQEENKKSDGSS